MILRNISSHGLKFTNIDESNTFMSTDIYLPLCIESANGILFTLQSMSLSFKRDKYHLAVFTADTITYLLTIPIYNEAGWLISTLFSCWLQIMATRIEIAECAMNNQANMR